MIKKEETFHLLILIGISLLTIILFFRFSTEDSYITYRYAQNLADGNGFVYNKGEKFLGTTAPSYALLLSFFGLLGLDIPSAGGILSSLSLGLVVLLMYLLFLRKGYPRVGVLFGLAVILNPWFLQTFGSETYFQLLMIVSAFYSYDKKKYVLTAVFCALAFLIRADGIIPGILLSLDYTHKHKKIPLRETITFVLLSLPLFIFSYAHFGSLLPGTLAAKQAQYNSGLWWKLMPGTFEFAKKILSANSLLYGVIPLIIIGGVIILISGRIWILIASWAVLHTMGYISLKVSFYHWYMIPLIFLLMLAVAFSSRFTSRATVFFKEDKKRIRILRIFNQEINISLHRFKDTDSSLIWASRLGTVIISALILIVIAGGLRAYIKTYRALPFPKLQLYTKAGRWISRNTPAEASVSCLETGYFGYHAQRKIIDLVGLITPGVSDHLSRRDFQWTVKTYQPDYFIYNEEFEGWLRTISNQPWFKESYQNIAELSQPGYRYRLLVFKKVRVLDNIQALQIDNSQEQSDVPVGEIVQGIEIGQTFFCHHENLTQIQVMLATYNRENHQEVIFRLKTSPHDTKDIHSEKFNTSDVIDNASRSFNFPPISDSKGKEFYFSLESSRSKPGDAITVWATESNSYKEGSLYINRKKAPGDLRFSTFCLQ